MIKKRSIATLTLDGGVLPFHLINTVYSWKGENLHEYLNSYDEFLTWCAKVEVLKSKDIRQLRSDAAAHPAKSGAAFRQIVEVRKLLYQFFSVIALQKEAPQNRLMAIYNEWMQEALRHYEWKVFKKGPQFVLKEAAADLLCPLWIVLKAAHDLVLSEDPARIKECPHCGWIFLDTTKNNKRKWCSPETCGSIDKAKKYYRKKVQALNKAGS